MRTIPAAVLALILHGGLGHAQNAPLPTALTYGPHAVGYRVVDHWDRSRTRRPLRDFEGREVPGERAMPMQISVWYPAQPGGAPMRVGEYRAIASKNETLGPITEADVAATAALIRGPASSPMRAQLSQATADSIRDLRTRAVRDARVATGRFPLLVTSFGVSSNHRLAEYLASHGYVVVASPTVGTAAQQVNRVAVAIESHTRTMETLRAFADALPFVDDARFAVIGLNFDGLAALTFQMRNMSADAVVSIDGYETKTNSATGLRTSPYFDPVRMRVPYLSFAQDNPPSPALAFSDSLARELKYADRHAYVIRDMDHITLLDDRMIYPQLPERISTGYAFLYRTIRAFLDANIKGDTAARAFMSRSSVANGFPDSIVKVEVKLPPLPPIPTPDEVERLASIPDVDRLRAIYRQARSLDPGVRMFTAAEMNLFAFRFRQRPEISIQFNELAVEAFPASTSAANNLGNTLRDAGQMPRAIELWEKALTLIDADPEIPASQKAQGRTNIENKIRQARGGY